MTRKELIKAIYDAEWYCPRSHCDLPEQEGNTGNCCLKCAEKQLANYEKKIYNRAIDDLIVAVKPYTRLNLRGMGECHNIYMSLESLKELGAELKEKLNGKNE